MTRFRGPGRKYKFAKNYQCFFLWTVGRAAKMEPMGPGGFGQNLSGPTNGNFN